jgi:hypothetical protein
LTFAVVEDAVVVVEGVVIVVVDAPRLWVGRVGEGGGCIG